MRPTHKHDGDLRARVLLRSFQLERVDEWHRGAGRTLSNRAVWAPPVEVVDILGKAFLERGLMGDNRVAGPLGPDRSPPARGQSLCPGAIGRGGALGKYRNSAPADRSWRHNSCRG